MSRELDTGRSVGLMRGGRVVNESPVVSVYSHRFLEEPASLSPSENVPSPAPHGVGGTANPRMTLFGHQGGPVCREWPRDRHITQAGPVRVSPGMLHTARRGENSVLRDE